MRGLVLPIVLLLQACGPAETDVTVKGTVLYPEFATGEFEIKLVEEKTEQCDLTSCVTRTPGETVVRTRLGEPGTFSMSASVQGSTMHLLAFAFHPPDKPWECEAGAMTSLSVDDHSGIILVLEPGMCPALD